MILRCPVCREELRQDGKSVRCGNGHCYDFAKEGYLNLLAGNNKNGSVIGDNRDMAQSRRSFLNGNYFRPLLDAVDDCLCRCCSPGAVILDVCCGEGYYSAELQKRHPDMTFVGFDISKEMVRLAAKRKTPNTYFVANISDIPVPDNTFDFIFHLFAPFHEAEFFRVLKPGGTLVTAVAGENHLWQMKEILYDIPYKNDEKPPKTENRFPVGTSRAKGNILLPTQTEIQALLRMTPYCYHTPTAGLQRLERCESLRTDIEFVLYSYQGRKKQNDTQ